MPVERVIKGPNPVLLHDATCLPLQSLEVAHKYAREYPDAYGMDEAVLYEIGEYLLTVWRDNRGVNCWSRIRPENQGVRARRAV